MFAIFAAFFGTIACADAVLVTSALRTWSGLEEPSPYRASQRYNAELRAARAQSARGWTLASTAVREGRADAALSVTLRDGAGAPLEGRSLRARLERPADKRADLSVALAPAGRGTYAGRLAGVASGQWDLVVEVVEAERLAFRRRHRIILD
ncbi:hypothetical protein MTDSW087_02434 [Methylobacterium dankookense]|uniref:FixH n=2 Tax=Methylobacterium dankookense TaxID=560405 RepID=A0A564FZC6_9HYPH|nr:FixH family protein [Methylobacterium dankookense]GJD54459.1 hypothetical protein IFDJLNFL_0331 [Methylobacterium dankookense]VUF12741.1 hypothetical protein MTDSW087_02434 [Methylobacterium dankookense]